MTRIPSAQDLTVGEWACLRDIVLRSFTPKGQIGASHRKRLLELGLIQYGMGGMMPTPAGHIVARL
jgi:hypothetical protein